jgi:hypothetical protein
MPSTAIGALIQALGTTYPTNFAIDSPYDILENGEGRTAVSAQQNLTNNGATTINQFIVHYPCMLTGIYLDIETVADSTVFSTVGWELWDGAAGPDITGDADCSGCEGGSILVKSGLLAAGPILLDGATAVTADPGVAALRSTVYLMPHNTGTTYLRMRYTGNAATDVTVRTYLMWIPMVTIGNICITAV